MFEFVGCGKSISDEIGDLVDEPLALVPSEAGIRDGLTVYASTDLLASFHDIALDHEALDE